MELRRYKRLPLRGILKCYTDFTVDDHAYHQVPVISLSAGGMFIPLDKNIQSQMEPGTMVHDIHFGVEAIDSIHTQGMVMHRMTTDGIGGCGVQFVKLTEAGVQCLDDYVTSMLNALGV